MSYHNCQSCGMPVETGPYCVYCGDENGNLHGFDETVARMAQFYRRQDPKLGEAESRAKTMKHMATMPAWKDHPRLKTGG